MPLDSDILRTTQRDGGNELVRDIQVFELPASSRWGLVVVGENRSRLARNERNIERPGNRREPLSRRFDDGLFPGPATIEPLLRCDSGSAINSRFSAGEKKWRAIACQSGSGRRVSGTMAGSGTTILFPMPVTSNESMPRSMCARAALCRIRPTSRRISPDLTEWANARQLPYNQWPPDGGHCRFSHHFLL